MALQHAILVALSERASSGYELAGRFEKSIGYFWTATHQQIYKVLARMESAGWVQVTLVTQDDRPNKKVYDITPSGRQELSRWIAVPAELEVTRSEIAVKVRGASYGDPAVVADEVERHLALHVQRLDTYLLSEKYEFHDPSHLDGAELHQYLVLRGGISYERGAIEWCYEVLAALRARPPARSGPRRQKVVR